LFFASLFLLEYSQSDKQKTKNNLRRKKHD
jgi:hypothetical protein